MEYGVQTFLITRIMFDEHTILIISSQKTYVGHISVPERSLETEMSVHSEFKIKSKSSFNDEILPNSLIEL